VEMHATAPGVGDRLSNGFCQSSVAVDTRYTSHMQPATASKQGSTQQLHQALPL
jgi:hypothetical protein